LTQDLLVLALALVLVQALEPELEPELLVVVALGPGHTHDAAL